MKRLSILILMILLTELAWAACTPERMVMIEFRDATASMLQGSANPPLEEGSFASKPKVLYRYGDQYGRLEEAPDPENGIHALVIVNKRDAWQINRFDGRIRHIVDPDPDGKFLAPVFGRPDGPDLLNEYEFGCEMEFMKSRGIEPETVMAVDRELETYSFSEGIYDITLVVDPDDQLPVISMLYVNKELDTFMKYLSYVIYRVPDLTMFAPPDTGEED